jgi:Domain of unknown function (DUF4416)
MASPRPAVDSLLVVAAFSRHESALAWARQRLQEAYGAIALVSPPFSFHHTDYYHSSMGIDLRKQILGFEHLIVPDSLPDIKLHTNRLEQELANAGLYPEQRPLNLDPGLLQLGKFMLATTKDQAHRIYLRDGIYAEVTLRFQAGVFEPWPWTYADYREPAVREFLATLREYYRLQLAAIRLEQPENPEHPE